jgi:2-methylcitrate dehydratase PrpD
MSDVCVSAPDLSRQFAERLIALKPEQLTRIDRQQINHLLLDYGAVTYGGAFRPWVTELHRWARRYEGSGFATVVGTKLRTSPAVAALVNGTAAHSFELDDTHAPTLSHPGSVVIAASLAVAAETKSSGAETIAAIVAGYEAIDRIGVASNIGKVMKFGFHPTPLLGGFGAAVAAIKLHGLGVQELLESWGHVLSLCGGSMQFSDEATGADVKRLHGGYAAHNGILAVDMTSAGFKGPNRALDGKYGFLSLFGRDVRPEEITKVPDRLAIHLTSIKPYACCRQLHAMIDCIDAIKQVSDIDYESTKSIMVRGPKSFNIQHMLRRPASSAAAQYSVPFVTGATIAFGSERWDAFEDQNLNNENILPWADMVRVQDDEDIERSFPDQYGAEVKVEWKDGRSQTVRKADGLGSPVNPLSWETLIAKAERVTENLTNPIDIQKLSDAVEGLFNSESVDTVNRSLTSR